MPQYLTSEWFKAAQDALDNSSDISEATRGQNVVVEEHVSDTPHGDVVFTIHFNDGKVAIDEGPADSADIVMRTDYDMAAAMQRGEQNTMAAFMGGKLKVEGDLTRVMPLQKAQGALDTALQSVDTQY